MITVIATGFDAAAGDAAEPPRRQERVPAGVARAGVRLAAEDHRRPGPAATSSRSSSASARRRRARRVRRPGVETARPPQPRSRRRARAEAPRRATTPTTSRSRASSAAGSHAAPVRPRRGHDLANGRSGDRRLSPPRASASSSGSSAPPREPGGTPPQVTLVAVSKTVAADRVQAAVDAGLDDPRREPRAGGSRQGPGRRTAPRGT